MLSLRFNWQNVTNVINTDYIKYVDYTETERVNVTEKRLLPFKMHSMITFLPPYFVVERPCLCRNDL